MKNRVITFRDYQDSDRAVLVALIGRFWDDLIAIDPYRRLIHEDNYNEVYTSELLNRLRVSEGRLIWAHLESDLIGFVAIEIEQQSLQNQVEVGPSRAGRVLELYVLPEHRSRRVGAALMHKAEQALKDAGCDTIKIEVFAPNERARRFYGRLGYSDLTVDVFKRLK